MVLEHIGLNVAEPQKVMAWWCENLGFTQTHPVFIVDSSGRMAIEFYRNDAAPITDFTTVNPNTVHIAFTSEDTEADAARLVAAGATLVETIHREGFDMAMLRDPFGIPVQFVKRAQSILLK
ncbi:MAG: VOC family protein [Kiritimatiellae bacterium]|nr:VOC family protein [Kiritimatiellia bacterium]